MANASTARHATLDFCALTAAEEATIRVFASGADGFAEAASHLGVSPRTVENRVKVICEKLGVRSRREAVELWRRMVAA